MLPLRVIVVLIMAHWGAVAMRLAAAGEGGSEGASGTAGENPSPQLHAQWEQCARDLNHDTFARREQATGMLLRAGGPATALVVEAFKAGDPETRFRALHVLRANVWSKDLETSNAARSALRQLAASSDAADSKVAQGVLRQLSAEAVRQLEQRGARLERDSQGNVRKVNFAQTKIGDEALRPLVELRPAEIDLRFTQVTDEGLEYLRGQTQLEVLNLQATGITDAGMGHLAELTRLRSISVERTAVTDEGLVHLKDFSQLKILYVGGSKISGPGLKHVQELPIEYLSFCDSPVDDSVVEHVLRLRTLKTLGFDKTRITDAGVEPLAGLEHLEVLWLDQCPISDKCVVPLQKMKGLKTLHLKRTPLTEPAIAQLKRALQQTRVSTSD